MLLTRVFPIAWNLEFLFVCFFMSLLLNNSQQLKFFEYFPSVHHWIPLIIKILINHFNNKNHTFYTLLTKPVSTAWNFWIPCYWKYSITNNKINPTETIGIILFFFIHTTGELYTSFKFWNYFILYIIKFAFECI